MVSGFEGNPRKNNQPCLTNCVEGISKSKEEKSELMYILDGRLYD